MRILKGLALITMISVAAAYWMNSRPKQEIDLSASSAKEVSQTLTDPVDFELTDVNGRSVKLSQFRGRPILVNFWASWCPPCIEELPSLIKFSEWGKKEFGLVTLAVSVDESWGPINKLFMEKKLWPLSRIPITILWDKESKVPVSYGTQKYPETFFIDKNFKVARKFVGVQNWTSEEIMKWATDHSK